MALSVKLTNSLVRPALGSTWSSRPSVNLFAPSKTRHPHQVTQVCHQPGGHLSRATLYFNSQPVMPESASILLSKSSPQTTTNDAQNDSSRPSEEQLARLSERMTEHLPKFFEVPHDFRMYNRNIVFEDNIRNVRTVGLNAYAWQMALVKMGAHFKYGKVRMNILKITTHMEDSTIRVRWRVVTYPGNSIVLAFWQFKLWKARESLNQYKDDWIDGFSIFHVGGDGLIHKHVCDKVIPDTDEVAPKKNPNLALKLGMALGLIPAGEGFAEGLLHEIFSHL